MEKFELNNKKVINSWAMYDWANSVFSLTIATAIFPIYFNKMCKNMNSHFIILLAFS